MALKITADRIALSGLCNFMILSPCSAGIAVINRAGIIAKYLATSLAILKVVNVPLVINNCLPISTTSINLVGSLSRSTIFPASFAACVPEFMATPTSACAKAGASFVPSPIIATKRPSDCSFLM
ncbi:hypothetical protein D3C81_1151290 [compost metagenome]